jgi:hypothetical protein
MQLIDAESTVMKPGDVYGRYTVLGISRVKGGYQKYAHVQCSCGSDARYVQIGQLRNGDSQSCGCLHKERVTKHGMWQHPLFNVWKNMRGRCHDIKNKRFKNYGGRGISICDSWENLENFIADMAATYQPGLTIDRIDNDGPYSPENCRWATRFQQNRNYSRNRFYTHDGRTMCLKEWSEALGINYGTLHDRLNVQKLPFHVAITI